jgi:methionyl-tRNA formyltransferase
VGAVEEGRRCLEGLLAAGERFAGLVTLKEEWALKTSGAVPFDDLAERYVIPLLKVKDLNHPANVERLRAMRPDLILVVGWTRLVGNEILALPPRGCVGFHASLLPKYRGRAPVNWAIINGESETGNSMIFLDEGVDTGDIIDQRRMPITPEDDCRTLYEKVSDSAIEMLLQHLPALKAGTAPRRRQDHSRATVMPRRRPEDGLMDWSGGARRLYDWVRALTHPYPGAFTFAGRARVYVWRAVVEEESGAAPPGVVLKVTPGEGVVVGAGQGSLRVTRTQVEGKPEETAGETAGRLGWTVGMRVGGSPPGGAEEGIHK